MEDGEGGLSFDFEGGLDAAPTQPTASVPVIHQSTDNGPSASAANLSYSAALPSAVTDPASGAAAAANFAGRRSYRQTVCRHWLRSLCMKGEACGFLHQYDKSRMPICRFFRLYGECREQDCVYKHTNEDIKECNMYKLGFCPNGPDCRYRHAKLPGPPPSVEEVLQKIQQLTSYNYGNSNRFFQNRNANHSQQSEKFQFPQGNNDMNQATKPATTDSASLQPVLPSSPQQQQQQQVAQSQQQVSQLGQPQAQSNGQQNQANKTSIPLPQGTSRCGCAKMTSKTGGSVGGGNWKYEHGTAHYGRNFCVKWLKGSSVTLNRPEAVRHPDRDRRINKIKLIVSTVQLCELSFHKTRHLRNPYNENLPVKISRDCQELEPSIGEQLASLLYLEPDSELMAISLAAESKREEEKAKGVNPENASENPDIVPFEDNEEEEEEESEEDEDSFEQGFGLAAQGRGRGSRGMIWPPHMPMGRGPRPMPGMRGFPPLMNMMGGDGFSFGGVGPDGFPVPDLMNMGPRGFGPFGPRFSGDFQRPPFAGMMFHGRPGPHQHGNFPGGGFGMMMGPGPGPGRAPFMGLGGGVAGRGGGRPVYPQPQQQLQPPQNTSRSKRDQVAVGGNDRYSGGGGSQPIGQDIGRPDDEGQPGGENTFKNGESESEDEAPRRSRHGEGKKKRRGSEGDAATNSDDKI
ncbi:YTH domain-containing protein [Cynara cardunculus var. scolymus]|uniref:YTH domain-containing protein n=1 Tax=Cynara cardunculus var. scolymus TaxID=59895 RepID=A0A103XB66_CYNCS|nr:YTH domain-containing protein [Cynara cardunculus var. scolymus]